MRLKTGKTVGLSNAVPNFAGGLVIIGPRISECCKDENTLLHQAANSRQVLLIQGLYTPEERLEVVDQYDSNPA